MPLDRLVLILVVAAAALYLLAVLIGLIALLPWGLIGIGVLAITGYVLWRVIRDRLANAEDDYYERNVEK